MSSTGKGKWKAAGGAAAEETPPVPNDSLEDIFLRLDAADLARASTACTTFRGIINDRSFRRRFGRLHHPPPLVGFLESEGPASLHPRKLHHTSTPAARAVAGAADFACSFLPDPSSWRISDVSDGRLLLSSRAATNSRDLIVCDPLHSKFVRVPPVPDDLTTGSFGWFTFLVPLPVPAAAAAGEKEEEPPLQVVSMRERGKALLASVFSSSTQEWRRVPTFYGWRNESPMLLMSYRLYVHGCFYWTSCHFRSHIALKLYVREMKFSTMQLPSVTQSLSRTTNFIVEADGGGDLGALVLGDHSLDLYCQTTTREEGNAAGAAADDWRHSRTVPLPDDNLGYSIIGAADGYLLLQAYPLLYIAQKTQQVRYFSVKLKTLVFEELPLSFNKKLVFVHLYTNFPPLLSLPSVCNEKIKTGQDQGVTGEKSATTSDASRTISSTS